MRKVDLRKGSFYSLNSLSSQTSGKQTYVPRKAKFPRVVAGVEKPPVALSSVLESGCSW